MRHGPGDADDDAEMLDERFRELVVQLAPHVRPPPVDVIRRTVRRRRLRNRFALAAAALVLLTGGVGIAREAVDERSASHRVDVAVAPTTSQGATVPGVAGVPLRETMFPAPREFPLVPGVYEDWRVIDTRAVTDDNLGPCTSRTISGLGAVETRERLYSHGGQGGGLVVLVRYPDVPIAEQAMSDFVDGFTRNCPTNARHADGNDVPGIGIGIGIEIKSLDRTGEVWRTYGKVDGQVSYSDYGIVRTGSIIAVVNESVIGGREPDGDTIRALVEVLRVRMESDDPSR